MEALPGQVTGLLQRWSSGDAQALEQLVPILYNELQRLAHYYLRRERDGHTLQTTALVHEAWLRIVGQEQQRWENRAQFFIAASEAMRRILVDRARRRQAVRHDAGLERVELDSVELPIDVWETWSADRGLAGASHGLKRRFPGPKRDSGLSTGPT